MPKRSFSPRNTPQAAQDEPVTPRGIPITPPVAEPQTLPPTPLSPTPLSPTPLPAASLPSGPPAWAVLPTPPVAESGSTVAPDDQRAPDQQLPVPDQPGQEEAPSGWRRALRRPGRDPRTAGAGARVTRRPDLVERVQRSLTGSHQVAVVSLKGGVGKTTTAALLGLALSEHRPDRVLALDAGPVGGTLADRLLGGTTVTIRDLIEEFDRTGSPEDVLRFTGLAGRLRVLASDQDLERETALDNIEYERVCLLLQRHFEVIVTDGATGMAHPAMAATLALADSIVVVGSRTVDGAGRASKTLDWLIAHGHRAAAERAVLVLDGDRSSDEVDAVRLQAHFAARCRAVVEIPHDPHLAQGGHIDVAALLPGTVDAALEVAALIADEFGAVVVGRDHP